MGSKPVKAIAETPNALRLARRVGESEAETLGRMLCDPLANTATVAHAYASDLFRGADINASIDAVTKITERVKAGDLEDLEAMLIAQATALQTMFVHLANRAQRQQLQRNFNDYLGMALKAQAQSRATISALVDLKFPRQVSYVKQANINNGGQQQVNNGTPAPRSGEADAAPPQTRILRNDDGQWLDPGAACAPSRADQELAAVGADDRAKNARGKSARRP